MEYFNNFEEINLNSDTAISIGKFETIHIGHQSLIDEIVSKKKKNVTAVVISVKTNENTLFTFQERYMIFEKMGVDVLIEIDINKIKNYTPYDFVKNILIDKIKLKYLCCGEDFRFGINRSGNINSLKDFSAKFKFELITKGIVKLKGENVSSSKIKEHYKEGNIEKVNEMLRHTVFLYGEVINGNKIGRTIGVPTANVKWPETKILPPRGVYAVKVSVRGKMYYGIANIGIKPTIGNYTEPLIEVNIFNFDEDIYGEKIYIHLISFVRSERKFKSIEELERTLKSDVYKVKKILNS